MSLGQSYSILGCSRKSGRKSQGKLQLCEASRLKTHQLEYSFCMERARSCLSTHFRSHREGVCGQKHMSIHFRAVLHSWAEDTQLGQDFVAARCLPVCDIEGNEWTTTVAGFRSIERLATIHHIALYLSAGLKRELGGLVHTCTLRDGWL